MKKIVWLVQQGIWDMPKESMPLAVGYLTAAALADEAIRKELDIRVFNFGGGASVTVMAQEIFGHGTPDVLAFSVFGWSYRSFGALAETFKQQVRNGWVVFGGTHVANQSERVFRQFPQVDVVANGEGEFVFADLLRAYLAGRSPHELGEIAGISYRTADGVVCTTPAPERIQNLDSIPSPVLNGAIQLVDALGQFRYDVAIMETNRGCPYSCAFCFWGGAIGQKVRSFSRERLQAELEVYGYHKVHTIALCDANFGMLKQDLDFMEDAIHTREKYGYPRAIETSWAKNKSKTFYEIVSQMKAAGMQSSFTLALQTLDETALDQMKRKNMRVNDWEDLVHWLRQEGLDCYAELIWGAPGETYQSFLDGYDRLARYVNRIATYPLLLLPNTAYSNAKEDYGFITVRGQQDDFEYVLAHNTMTFAENLEMQRFLVWARAIAENLIFRHIWGPLRELAGMSQSAILTSLMMWFRSSEHPSAVAIGAIHGRMGQASAFRSLLQELHSNPDMNEILAMWWRESIAPQVPSRHLPLLTEVFRYDCISRPVYDEPGLTVAPELELIEFGGEPYYRRTGLKFNYDVPALVQCIREGGEFSTDPKPVEVSLYYKVGFHQYIDNHEEVVYFVGLTLEQLEHATKPVERSNGAVLTAASTQEGQRL